MFIIIVSPKSEPEFHRFSSNLLDIMAYKWCVVPRCNFTSLNSPNKLFISVPKKREIRELWLHLARRDPNSISSHPDIFMCEDHFNVEKDTTNYMQYKMGFSKKLLISKKAVPSRFHCQEGPKRRMSASSREVFLKKKRMYLIRECLQSQSQSAAETNTESSQKDDHIVQEITAPEESPKAQDKEISRDPIITTETSITVRKKENLRHRSKDVQTVCRNKSISTSPLKATTLARNFRFTMPYKIRPCRQQQSQSAVVKTVKRNIVLADEKSDSDIPKTQGKETIRDPIPPETSVQARKILNVHHMSKDVQTVCQNRSISTSPLEATTLARTFRFTMPYKIRPCRQRQSQSAVVKTVKRNIVLADEKSDCDIPKTQSKETISDSIIPPETNIVLADKKSDCDIPKTQGKETIRYPIIPPETSVQARKILNVHHMSKDVQTVCQNRSISTSPLETTTLAGIVRSTMPYKIRPCRQQSAVLKTVSDNSSFERGNSSPFVATSSSRVTDCERYVTDTNENNEQLECFKNTVRLIEKQPLLYVGISKQCYFLIHLLHKHTNIKTEYIFLCLRKIRMNTHFSILDHHFGTSPFHSSKLFLVNIPIISSFLRPFIVNLDKKLRKDNLSIVFGHNYNNVSCIIDCLEINIEKPFKAFQRAQTWSEYKKEYTVKYIISCTPDGLIDFVSQGFGGRTSDITMVENCNFLNRLKQGSCILADRGFKDLEQKLHKKGIKLLMPPSASAGEKLTKTEVQQTKIIATLRIHMERAIGLIRKFHMLNFKSVKYNNNMLCVLDHVIIIACALVNLQKSVIK